MATHAYSTTALLRLPQRRDRLLPQGHGRQVGPVTQAIRAMRAADPDAAPLDGRQVALDLLRAEDPETERVPALRALRLALIASIEGKAVATIGRRA